MALALLHASMFRKDIGITQFIIEGNALQVIQLLKHEATNWCHGGLIIQGAKNLLNSFAIWCNSHVKRKGNQMAHLLAKDALSLISDMYDLEVILDFIRNVIHLNSV